MRKFIFLLITSTGPVSLTRDYANWETANAAAESFLRLFAADSVTTEAVS